MIIYSYVTLQVAKGVPIFSNRYYVVLSSFVHPFSLIIERKFTKNIVVSRIQLV